MAHLARIASAAAAQTRFGLRAFASDSAYVKDMGGAFKDRESAFENAYFNKEEHLKMEALIKKLRRQIEPTPEENAADKKALQAILVHHKVTASDAVINDLMKWRFGK